MSYQDQTLKCQETYKSSCERIYAHISKEGAKSFKEGGPLYKYRDGKLAEKLIKHFESTEEYEKCGVLVLVNKELKGEL
mgnify:FL=1